MASYLTAFDEVYAALDGGDYKLAQKLCLRPEIALYTLSKALLAYAYSCTNEQNRAMEIANLVATTKPVDEAVLNALGCTFKALRAEKELADLYENALKQRPLPDATVIDLFTCYCRQYDPKKMQQVAQREYKADPKKVYYLFWSVTCMLLQDLPAQMRVVAEKTAQKALYDLSGNVQPSADEMSIYAYILALQGKYSTALQALTALKARPQGQSLRDEAHFKENVNLVRIHTLQYSIHRLDLMVREGLELVPKVIDECRVVLDAYPDQWNVHELLISCLTATVGGSEAVMLLHRGTATAVKGEGSVDTVQPTKSSSCSYLKLQEFPEQNLRRLFSRVLTTSAVERGEPSVALVADGSSFVLQQLYLRELQIKHSKYRGPFLAEIQLLLAWAATLRVSCGSGDAHDLPTGWTAAVATVTVAAQLPTLVKELLVLILNYVIRFRSKQCCFSDLKPFIHSLFCLQYEERFEALRILLTWAMQERSALYPEVMNSIRRGHDSSNGAIATKSADPTSVTAEEGIEDHTAQKDDEDTSAAVTDVEAAKLSKSAKKNKKKKSNKKKKAAGGSDAAVLASLAMENDQNAASAAVVDQHSEVLLHLCMYCKMDQIVSYVQFLLLLAPDDQAYDVSFSSQKATESSTTATLIQDTAEAVVDCSTVEHRLELYRATRRLFLNGVGGEERNVQPGDELLMLNSAVYRSAVVSEATDDASVLSAAARWCRCLLYAKAASAYSFAFKIDLLEACRFIGLGELAVATFTELGVKHMQNDSMNYLLTPLLLETGMFADAARMHRTVQNFHRIGRRDSLDMMGRAFQFGNYMKVMELNRFVDRCERSTQLVLSRAEVVQVDLVHRHHTLASASKYLQDLLGGTLSNQYAVMDTLQLQELVDFMDYDLLVRTDVVDAQKSYSDSLVYRKQMELRIQTAQRANHMLHSALRGQIADAGDHARHLLESLTSADDLNSSEGLSYLSWNQQISSGSLGTGLIAPLKSCLIFCLRCLSSLLQTSSSSAAASTTAAAADDIAPISSVWSGNIRSVKDLQSALLEATTACFDLRNILLKTENRLLDVANSAAGPIRASWIHLVSAFVRTFGTWLPLLLQSCLGGLPEQSISSSGVITFTAVLEISPEEKRSQESCSSHIKSILRSFSNNESCSMDDLKQSVAIFTEIFFLLLNDLNQLILKEASGAQGRSISSLQNFFSNLDPSFATIASEEAIVVDSTGVDESAAFNLEAVREVVDLCADDDDGDIVDAVVVQSPAAPVTASVTAEEDSAAASMLTVHGHTRASDVQQMLARSIHSCQKRSLTSISAVLQERLNFVVSRTAVK